MRIPAKHVLGNAYIAEFGLPTAKFTMSDPNTLYYMEGRRHTRAEVEGDPGILDQQAIQHGGAETPAQFWEALVRQTTERLKADEGYWDELLQRYGDHSLLRFFASQGSPLEAITAHLSILGLEPVSRSSVLEMLRVTLAWQDTGMIQVVGGMDRLPRAFLPEIGDSLRLNAEMVALDYTENSVTVHYRTGAGLGQVGGDFAILTLPFSALRFVDVLKSFSPGKQVAIRHLNYHNAVKILLECRRRFWEEDDGIFGGTTVTDLPIQQIVYPEHGRETGRGVLIGCYTYDREANRWGSLPPEERISQVLKYVSRIHPQVTAEFETGASKVWGQDRFAGGAFAIFEPGQEAMLYAHITAPEGPVYFAGEHVSLKHSWIEGAVESGLRAAAQVHECAA